MTTSPATISFESDHERASKAVLPVALGAFVIAAATLAVGNFSGGSSENQVSVPGYLVMIAIVALVVAGVFGLVVVRGLRQASAGGRALVLAVIGLLAIPVFWTGLSIVLGPAAALLGYAGKRADKGATMSVIAFALGLLVCVAYVAISLGDYLHTHGLD
jgi:hypothetical protein